jgi:ferredoxin-nitrate reductase
MYTTLIPKLIQDPEVHGGLRVMRRITQDALNTMSPFVSKYGATHLKGKSSFQAVHDAVLPSADITTDYSSMVALKGLATCLADIEMHFVALVPASQALWDKEFVAAVTKAKGEVERMQAWARQQLMVRAPQTLVVPSRYVWEELS